jgi:hypothetical protein
MSPVLPGFIVSTGHEMETIDQLNSWLERPVYGDGVMLYQKLIGGGFVLNMLKKCDDEYNRRTLIDALTAKRDELITAQAALVERYPEPLTASLDDGKLLMDERTILKERMRIQLNSGVTESEELKEWAFRILDIRDELARIYSKKDFFDQYGYLPDVASVDAEQTPTQLIKRQLTLRTYVTRYRKKLNNLAESDESYAPNLARLQQYSSELHQVEQQLTAMTQPHVSI